MTRALYQYALALCETKQHLNRVPKLLQAAATLQNRDPATQILQSHFVLPAKVDEMHVDENAVPLHCDAPWELPVTTDDVIILRCDTATMGIRMPFAWDVYGNSADVTLVFGGNEHGALRLSVVHARPSTAGEEGGVCFWVRVGSGITDDATFNAWHSAFSAAKTNVSRDGARLRVEVVGERGPVAVAADTGRFRVREMTPAPTKAILELNGEDGGTPILVRLPN